ncbi:hypothetical protein JCM10450v2_004116 [Rhodotorula kratochvilovae]
MFAPSDAYKGNQDVNVRRYLSDGRRMITPWVTAVLAGVLAFSTSWMQAQSKDLLPRYVMYPAIIGAVCCGLFGCACVVGFFILRKYDTYHDRHANDHSSSLKRKQHPIAQWPAWFIFGTGVTAAITEGSYLYQLLFLIADDDSDYCVTFTPATSKDKCNNGVVSVLLNMAVLLGLVLVGGYYEHVVQEAVDFFENRKDLHASGALQQAQDGQGQGGQGGYYDTAGAQGGLDPYNKRGYN